MENRLELKHIAAYLPYELKAIDTRTKEIRTVTLLHFSYDNKTVGHNHLIFEGLMLSEHKPILRPLSDLTKQQVADMTEYSDIENVVFSGNPSNLYFVNTEEKTYLDDYVDSLEYLLKNHYDIFGLIEKGLAIDINTLTPSK